MTGHGNLLYNQNDSDSIGSGCTLTLIFIMIVMLFSGCGKQSGGGKKKKQARSQTNTLTVGIAQDFDSLDPHHMTAAGTKEVLFNVFEGLVKPDADGEIVPAVASEVNQSEDGLTYTFTLRDGVLFHNGDPVTMEDVIYSINRRRDGKDAAAQLAALSVIKDLKGEGNQLTITLSEPSNEFLAFLMNAYIIPADYTKQETAPLGTGPYRFVSRKVQDNLVLERFPDYWGKGGSIGRVTFKVLEKAGMSFLGIGVTPPDASLGYMLSEAQGLLAVSPWYALFTGLSIILLVFGIGLIGEGLQAENREVI